MSDKPYSEELRTRLAEYRQSSRSRPMTMTDLARELGVSSTRVNKYLTGKPEGNVAEFELLVEDLLKAAARRQVSDVPPFSTNVIRTLHGTFALVRKTNDIGLVSGPAGVGKSVAVATYCAENPTTIGIRVTRWLRGESGLVALLFDACETASWNGHTRRAAFLAERLRNSNRLIILDNAQRLTAGAREWLFDFHDETGCPIVLVGNPEVLVAIRRSDQQFSRIGINQDVRLDPAHISDYARQLVTALVPSPAAGLWDLATAVAEERGHLRALRKQVLLMQDLAAAPTYRGDQVRAFHAAHAKLVRDYEL